MTVGLLLGGIVMAIGLAYQRAAFWVWTLMAGLVLLTLAASVEPGPVWSGVIALLFLAPASVLNIPWLRRACVTAPALAAFRKALPPMSSTEREAIEAGTVWWDAELFAGNPNWDKLLAIRFPTLTADEQAFLDGPVEELCAMLDDWLITDSLRDLPEPVWRFLKDYRFFGMIIPEEYGGLGFSALAHSCVVVKIASRSVSAAVTVMVPNSLGPAELLLHYGTKAQKDQHLPGLANGSEIPCFALTGPEAGSDAGAIPDVGVVCRGEFDGEDIIGIRLNWDKRYITLGPVATLLGLAFKLHDPDNLIGDDGEPGITVALIPTATPGVTIGRRHRPMDQAFFNGPNQGKDVFIPVDWIIGGPDMAGKGWMMLMESLAAGRSISLPALSTGSGKVASRVTGAYAAIRRQFKTPVGQFEGVQEALARIGGNAYLMEATRIMTAGAIDLGEKPSVISAIAKYHLTERMRQVVNDAMDIHGGRGICVGPRNYLAGAYQGVPIGITVEGANILTRSLIIFGQGAIRCHPYVLKEMEAAADSDPVSSLREFDRNLFAHIGFTVSNAARAFVLGLTGARFISPPVPGSIGDYYRQFSRMSAALAISADVAMLLYGGRLKRLERLSARLGDVLSFLYLASAALKRFEDQGRQQADRPLLHWVCRDALHQIQTAFDELFGNLPNRLAGKLLRNLVFPTGLAYQAPNDANDRRVARLLLRPSAARDRLTDGIYLGTAEDPIGRVEDALLKATAAESAMRKMQRAARTGALRGASTTDKMDYALRTGIISERESLDLKAAETAREEAIRVDDFPRDLARTLHPPG